MEMGKLTAKLSLQIRSQAPTEFECRKLQDGDDGSTNKLPQDAPVKGETRSTAIMPNQGTGFASPTASLTGHAV